MKLLLPPLAYAVGTEIPILQSPCGGTRRAAESEVTLTLGFGSNPLENRRGPLRAHRRLDGDFNHPP